MPRGRQARSTQHPSTHTHQLARGTLTEQVKKALWDGGIERSNKPEGRRATPGLQKWQDLVRARGCWLAPRTRRAAQ